MLAPGVLLVKAMLTPGVLLVKAMLVPGVLLVKAMLAPGVLLVKAMLAPGVLLVKAYWTRAIQRFALFDLLKSLYSDTKILSKYIPSLQRR
jgi:hypothetical protein